MYLNYQDENARPIKSIHWKVLFLKQKVNKNLVAHSKH